MPVWYILTGDHIRLDGEEFEVLDKSLTPLGDEIHPHLLLKGTSMPYYRKKLIPVEARQFTGDNFSELRDWSHDHVEFSDYDEGVICVHTLEGPVWGEKGDYVVKGVRGEFYICQKDIFEETYEPFDKRDAAIAIAIRPTPVESMKPGDLFRDGGQTFQIADIKQIDDVVEIVYYTGTSAFINSFFLPP